MYICTYDIHVHTNLNVNIYIHTTGYKYTDVYVTSTFILWLVSSFFWFAIHIPLFSYSRADMCPRVCMCACVHVCLCVCVCVCACVYTCAGFFDSLFGAPAKAPEADPATLKKILRLAAVPAVEESRCVSMSVCLYLFRCLVLCLCLCFVSFPASFVFFLCLCLCLCLWPCLGLCL